jgi:sensor domain CHASE-containing protein
MAVHDGESTRVDLVYHLGVVNAANAEIQFLKADNSNLREANLALQVKLAMVHVDMSEALENAASWRGTNSSLVRLSKWQTRGEKRLLVSVLSGKI